MTCILYVVLCGDLLMGAFNRGVVDTRSYMMAAGLLLLPCAFLKNLQVYLYKALGIPLRGLLRCFARALGA